jgi:hypothetical protein
MNQHLQMAKEFYEILALPEPQQGVDAHLSDMNIIMYQALLMESGSETLKAIKIGEMGQILTGLVDLAYVALAAIAAHGEDVIENPVTWRHDGFVLSIMQLLSDKISRCASGNTESYSELYCLCVQLARSFLNADFDKAFKRVHEKNLSTFQTAGKYRVVEHSSLADLSDCLYE